MVTGLPQCSIETARLFLIGLLFRLHLRHTGKALIIFIAFLRMLFGYLEHLGSHIRKDVDQRLIPHLTMQEVLIGYFRFLGVKLEGVLTLFPEEGVVSVKMPVS